MWVCLNIRRFRPPAPQQNKKSEKWLASFRLFVLKPGDSLTTRNATLVVHCGGLEAEKLVAFGGRAAIFSTCLHSFEFLVGPFFNAFPRIGTKQFLLPSLPHLPIFRHPTRLWSFVLLSSSTLRPTTLDATRNAGREAVHVWFPFGSIPTSKWS